MSEQSLRHGNMSYKNDPLYSAFKDFLELFNPLIDDMHETICSLAEDHATIKMAICEKLNMNFDYSAAYNEFYDAMMQCVMPLFKDNEKTFNMFKSHKENHGMTYENGVIIYNTLQ